MYPMTMQETEKKRLITKVSSVIIIHTLGTVKELIWQ